MRLPSAADGVEHGDRAGQVGAVGAEPVGDALFDRGDGGEVEAAVHTFQRLGDRAGSATSPSIQRDAGWQVGAATGRQIVQHAHPVAARDQRIAQVGADEACAAGDKPGAHAVQSGVRAKHLAQNRSVGQAIEALVDLRQSDGIPNAASAPEVCRADTAQ